MTYFTFVIFSDMQNMYRDFINNDKMTLLFQKWGTKRNKPYSHSMVDGGLELIS
jgi:hypothetical protein